MRLQTDPPGSPHLHHVVVVVPLYDVGRREELFLDRRGWWSGGLGFGFEEVRYIEDLGEEKNKNVR